MMQRATVEQSEGFSGHEEEEPVSPQDDISELSSLKNASKTVTETATDIQKECSVLADTIENLHEYSWESLQEKFSDTMKTHAQTEQALRDQTAKLLEVFMIWSQVAVSNDEDRAFKRFKTRMQHVQNSETKLEEKKKHYANVVKAFESALALLEG